ncbi:cystathionine gamma-lyase [Pseudoroseicyclus aestuarii]|uniref:Cystathionine gamma-lyase n=1 Tax=Pseudoroseicyclus aestuarii TaxID=1795041 RepID=A0A318T227_9RHOB|nr:cystathionine gamma-lyase [Pseudoroseicyclus aestuarii]PYE86037.1 cystathionine gamma-lyase [Pseudoroseicyclus aestuarii]
MTDMPSAADLLHLRGTLPEKGEPLSLPLTMSSVFHLPGDPAGVPAYGRMANPTWEAAEHALGHLEGAPALLFPSGMAAIAAAFFALLKAGDRLLLPTDGYYTSRLLAENYLARLGVEVEQRPTTAFSEGGFEGFAMVFLETPSNPGLDLIDIAETARAVRAAGGLTVVDNTTMTPFGQRPLALGADVVVAADTKAPGGHSDLLAGHLASNDPAILEAVRDWRKISGGIPGAFDAWLLHRSLETLELRFARMCDSAEVIAARLAAHPAVRAVRYPGLPGDPSHGLATSQMTRFGFLIGLTLADEEAAERLVDTCRYLRAATSFGGTHSSAERRARWGDAVDPGALRLSIGCEPVEELWQALDAALRPA